MAGGSPAASPISRWAKAKRVSESINKSTLLPWSRKYSAMAVAVKAACTRTIAGSLLVATTTTLLANPAGPRSRSRNSLTSRPRSPIRAITITSAEVYRAIMPSSTLLPTPEPAKIPIRCPSPQVNRPSNARTPVLSGRSMRGREQGCGGNRLKSARSTSAGRGLPSTAFPAASITRPSSPWPTRSQRLVRARRTRLPWRMPARSLMG